MGVFSGKIKGSDGPQAQIAQGAAEARHQRKQASRTDGKGWGSNQAIEAGISDHLHGARRRGGGRHPQGN